MKDDLLRSGKMKDPALAMIDPGDGAAVRHVGAQTARNPTSTNCLA
jgi:hypothetical protein